MENNDVLVRLRYALNITDKKVVELLKLVGYDIPREELVGIFMKEDEAGYVECDDSLMAKFLDALIVSRRGKRDDADPAKPEERRSARLTNNEILKRLRIALCLKDEDIIGILGLSGVQLSKSELTALFRKPEHSNFRPCGDQFLRNFLSGLTAKNRV